ncbi:MAG TPA: prepilin-type N-terminal cleavage/methylation domain-containing protein [Candidatus Eisenbacteria bacterium]|nr:prepilin-type N-terminal cleavage/methylation domain-containing protein [Candidatus Eisenbacteria bacterium]
MRESRSDRGFTMTELMVALSIIGVLAAVAIPTYLGFVTSTRAAQAVADLQALRAAVYLYYGDVGRWPSESPNGFAPKGVAQNLPKNFSLSNKWYSLDYDNWTSLHRQGRAPNGTTTAIGVSVVSRDPKLLFRIQRLIRDAKFTQISKTKYTLEIATVNGF